MWSKNISVVKMWSKAILRHKKDPQPIVVESLETL